jgi:hypothetical protein
MPSHCSKKTMVMIFSRKMMAIVFSYVITALVGIIIMPLINPDAIRAEDKSTSISFASMGMCDNTECIEGICDTS